MLSPRPYQNAAIDHIYGIDRSMVLAPVGGGKTMIAILGMAEYLRESLVKRFLVLAPKRVCTDVWPQEIAKWGSPFSFAVASGTAQQRATAFSRAQVVIINYDNLQWLCDKNAALLDGFDGLVMDELTKLRNPSGARFKALAKVIEPMKVRIGLTGSFTSNGLEDVYGQCAIVDKTLLGRSKGAFMQQYFICTNPEYGEFMPRPGALARVMGRIKPATFVLDAGEYADKLPPLNIVPMTCEMDLTKYKAMKRDLVLELEQTTITAVNAAVVTGKLQQMAGGWVYDTTKVPNPDKPGKWITTQTPVWFSQHKFDLLDEVLAENQRAPTIIVYNYVEELHELKRRYPLALTLDDTDAILRWNSGKADLLLVHPKSAGHGLNLQFGGCHMVFLSLPWSLELYEQVIGRLHRSGQEHAVWVYVLMTKDTIDERIFQVLQDKRDLSTIALMELVK